MSRFENAANSLLEGRKDLDDLTREHVRKQIGSLRDHFSEIRQSISAMGDRLRDLEKRATALEALEAKPPIVHVTSDRTALARVKKLEGQVARLADSMTEIVALIDKRAPPRQAMPDSKRIPWWRLMLHRAAWV